MNSEVCDRRAIPAGLRLGQWHAADGWSLRHFDWPARAPGRGSLLFLNGRGDFIEKYLEAAHHWHCRGWHVSSFDWRGQGGSGRVSEAAAGYATLLDRLLDDLEAYVHGWMARTAAPHVLVGHSMGGHLVLRLLAERGIDLNAVVLVAPMLGLNSTPFPPGLARCVTRLLCRIGLAGRSVWKESGRLAPDRQQRLTGCTERFADAAYWKTVQPTLRLGAPCWGWLAAAYASIARTEAKGALEKVRTPCLLLGVEDDRLVSAEALRVAARRLPDARLVMFATPGHEILREADATRLAAFAEIDGFLDERAPRP